MQSVRLRFEKKDNARFISHLDIMRCMARALRRAGIPIRFTGGFSPKPSLVFGNPLSLGYESLDECCDFDITDDSISLETALASLQKQMPSGLLAKELYPRKSKISDVGYARYEIRIKTDSFSVEDVRKLLSRNELVVLKHSKSGDKPTDILPMISDVEICDGIKITATLDCSTDSTLNPENISKAICENLSPEFSVRYRKLETLDREKKHFK